MPPHAYDELGLVAGLEIHQQLDTREKLFCSCPTELRDPAESTHRFYRFLHPTRSELGEIDDAALEESRVDRKFEYLGYDSTCLVEEDDEPPHRLDQEALRITLQVAQLLDMTVVDEVHVMRKIVIDGSNTSGFQRSAMVARDGVIETSEGDVSVKDLMLEEESAQRVTETESGVQYSLDRLGIPLVEIGTGPDIRTPEQAREAAETIGMMLRSTGAVKRGIGTIRQDVNVSIAEGARVELKGVQQLDDIDEIIQREVSRQVALLGIAGELADRDASVGEVCDVSGVFSETESGIVRGVLEGNGVVFALPLFGFDGLVGREIQPDRRLGTEFSDHAKRNGAGGIFHTDELPAYGITPEEVDSLMERVSADEKDAVVLVAEEPGVAEQAIVAVQDRAKVAMSGVPEETRGANEDTTSRYLRPLPGAARMYPETDVPPVEPDVTEVESPELLTEKAERYIDEYGLDRGLAEHIAYGRRMPLFEQAVRLGVDPTLAADTLTSVVTDLDRNDVPVSDISDEQWESLFVLLESGELAREAIPDVLAGVATAPDRSVEEIVEEEGLGSANEAVVREAVRAVVERRRDQIKDEGMAAFSGLMGECMGELRGKAEGELVSSVLREEINRMTE